MDLRDFGAVPIFDTKEEELEWRRKEEERLIADERKLGRPLTSRLRESSNNDQLLEQIAPKQTIQRTTF